MSILLREKKFEESAAEAKNHRLRTQAKGQVGIPVWEARQGSLKMKFPLENTTIRALDTDNAVTYTHLTLPTNPSA